MNWSSAHPPVCMIIRTNFSVLTASNIFFLIKSQSYHHLEFDSYGIVGHGLDGGQIACEGLVDKINYRKTNWVAVHFSTLDRLKVWNVNETYITIIFDLKSNINRYTRPVGKGGGFEGVRSNPPFGLQIILYTPPNLHLSALPFQSGPLVSLVLRFTAVQTSPVAATWDFHEKPPRNARVIGLRRCDERTQRVNICLKKIAISGAREFASCPSIVMMPACCSANNRCI